MTTYVYWVRGQEFYDLAQLSIASVKKVDRSAHFQIYTDDPELKEPGLCRLAPGRPAMVANLDAQVNALATAPYGERVLFLDADTLLKKPFPFCEADLFVTWRDYVGIKDGEKVVGIAREQPYNYGVVGAIASARSVEAFIWLRARILRMAKKHQDWYGNQLAMFDLVGAPQKLLGRKTATIRWALDDRGTDLSVMCLPCETHNYSPEAEGEDVSDKVILHMKGKRKELMQAYA